MELLDKMKNAGFDIRDGYVCFGEYPRGVKAEDVTVGDEADGRGYFKGSDGCYYALATAKPYCEECKFLSGEAISAGEKYYFKVEPIRWRVSHGEAGSALLVCDSIIDARRFDEKVKIYKDSEIRAWLNGEFLGNVFTKEEQERIETVSLPTEVNDYTAREMSDKVFLLSYSEAGKNQEARILKATDFGIAKGVNIRYKKAGILAPYTKENYGDGCWWLRSCISFRLSSALIVDYVDFYGSIAADYVYYSRSGVVPALYVKV